MEGEDIVGGLEFRYSHEPYLESLLAMMHEASETLTLSSEDATKTYWTVLGHRSYSLTDAL